MNPAKRVLADLYRNPPHGGVIHKPRFGDAPPERYPDLDVHRYWAIIGYLHASGFLRGNEQQGGSLTDVAVTPAGEDILGADSQREVPVLGALSEGQRQVFLAVAGAASAVDPHDREFHLGKDEVDGKTYITGARDLQFPVLYADVAGLVNAGLLEWTSQNYVYGNRFVVTAPGEQAYAAICSSEADRFAGVENDTRRYLSGAIIASRYPAAYRKWLDAEAQLATAGPSALTKIGHDIRECHQLYATELLHVHGIEPTNPNPASTVDRMRQVLRHYRPALGEKHEAFLGALLVYWGALLDLTQRVEHGAQKEGEQISWDDARQIVHQTANVIAEIDKTLPAPARLR